MANSKFIVKHGLKVGPFEVDAATGNITTTGSLSVNGASALTASSTDTLSNKSISLTSNTVTGTVAEFNAALSDGDFATLAGTETLTNKTIAAGSNTISGLTNSNLSGSAGISNANLANSSVTINGSSLSLGGSLTLDTDDLGEGTTNLYFTTARAESAARGAVSASDAGGLGSFSYNSGTGAFTYTGPSDSDVRGLVSATDAGGLGSFSYDSATGAFTYTGPSNSDVRGLFSATDAGGDGSFSYDSATGAFTYTGPSASEVRAHFSAGTGVTLSSGQISIGQAVGTTSDVTFNSVTVNGTLTSDDITSSSISIAGDATITGNLTVQGTTTTVNSTTVSLGDNIIVLNGGETGTPSLNAGLEVERGTSANVLFRWNETDDVWEYTNDGTTYVPVVGTTASQTLTNKTIAAGSNTISGLTNSNLSGSAGITNANLANSSVTIGSTSVSLGATASSLAGLTGVTATTFTGALSGNADTASKWATARTITLGGDLSGSVSIDGSANVTLTATVAANSVALGTDTTGDYVASMTAGTGITVGTATGEGSTPVIALSHLGIQSLTDPNADRILFWDDSAGAAAWLEVSTGLSLSGTTLTNSGVTSNVAGTGISVSGATGAVTITNTGVTSITGTANQVTASASTGGVTLSLPQSIHTGASPTFAGATLSSITKGGTSGTGDIGGSTSRFGTVYATTFNGTATTAQYADLAEKYSADADYEPGTVLCFGGDAEVTLCVADMCRKVAGVVTTAPAHLMNAELGGVAAAIALQGRVPCKVVGPVAKGDMMVAAGNGRARAEANPVMGSVIGKALENFDGGEGVIEVAVGRL